MKSQGFHGVTNQKVPGEPMGTRWLDSFSSSLQGGFRFG